MEIEKSSLSYRFLLIFVVRKHYSRDEYAFCGQECWQRYCGFTTGRLQLMDALTLDVYHIHKELQNYEPDIHRKIAVQANPIDVQMKYANFRRSQLFAVLYLYPIPEQSTI